MYRLFFKRFFDILISLTALIILGPFLFVVAIMVKFKLGSPAIFKQIRPGIGGKLFYIYKFRTMTDKTDEYGRLLPDEQRHTKFGTFLRRFSIDELPQLWNILKGDMSLVGPRPRLVKDVVFYAALGSLSVRPGLTGRSQVYGRNDNSWQQVFEHDSAYASKVTLFGDLKIFFLTFPAVFRTRQSEKRINKFYGDELLTRGVITKEKHSDGLNWAETIHDAFIEDDEQLLKESLSFIIEYNVMQEKQRAVAATAAAV